jgi:hypothetical protein
MERHIKLLFLERGKEINTERKRRESPVRRFSLTYPKGTAIRMAMWY